MNSYQGVAFTELGWGASTPVTTGQTYTIVYNANGATSGAVPDNQTAAFGALVTTRGNTRTLARTNYVFGGWNTEADGSGVTYVAGTGTLYMPFGGATLYAIWNPGPPAAIADVFTHCVQNQTCSAAAGVIFANDFSTSPSTIEVVRNTSPSPAGVSLVVSRNGSFAYTPAA